MNELALARFVRPRVVDHGEGNSEPVRIEDALERRLEQRSSGQVFLRGSPGAGKRTALEYARLYFDGRPEVAFGAAPPREGAPEVRLRVRVESPDQRSLPIELLELAPWARDEWIEYLLARHQGSCARVMARLEEPENGLELKGRPLLWAAILDELARDPGLPGLFEALRQAVRDRFSSSEAYGSAAEHQWLAQCNAETDVSREMRRLVASEPDAAPFLDQGCVQLLLGAEHVAGLLADATIRQLPLRLHRSFLCALRPLLVARPSARETLARILRGEHPVTRPARTGEPAGPVGEGPAASLLHLYGPTAVSEVLQNLGAGSARTFSLSGAELDGLEAPGASLRDAQLDEAHLAGAKLDGADLSRARLDRANLRGSSLRGAKLTGANLRHADLGGVDLRGAFLEEAFLIGAELADARLESAQLRGAKLDGAQLRRALLDRADLAGASLRAANLSEASLIDANLAGALLDGLDLRSARLETSKLANASLVGCNLERLRLEKPDLSIADLRDALLTGSHFNSADLRGAQLGGAGLANIEWPGANLREADLTDASFHLGSSRSGLVMAAPTSWGTRTGFYSEELRDSSFKRAQIRKADLRRADLRGARIFDTDFYLVDLRGALYTSDQEQHLRSCGAIL